jgi:ribosomal-protein-alanine N-acetyltransferase
MFLRPLEPDDRAEFVRVHRVSWELFGPWSAALQPDETFDDLFDRQLERGQRGLREGTGLRLVGMLADGRIAGFFSISNIVRAVFQSAYAGWAVNGEVIRKGIGTEGVQGMLDLAFAPEPAGLALHRIQANVIPENAASIRLAEKTGFRREGIGKKYLKIAGRWQDHIMFAKLAEEHAPVYLKS